MLACDGFNQTNSHFLCSVAPKDDEDQQEKTLSQVYDNLPEGCTPLYILKKQDERQCIGKRRRRRDERAR